MLIPNRYPIVSAFGELVSPVVLDEVKELFVILNRY
jgi:hypothetical protein